MLKKIAMTTVAASALLISMQASAHSNHHHGKHSAAQINKEQSEQAVMIQQGIKTCQITPTEARQLKSTQKRIADLEQRFKAHGLTPWESKTLHDKLHAARVEINKLTKNRSTCRTKKKYSKHRDYRSSKHRHAAPRKHVISSKQGKATISLSIRNVY